MAEDILQESTPEVPQEGIKEGELDVPGEDDTPKEGEVVEEKSEEEQVVEETHPAKDEEEE